MNRPLLSCYPRVVVLLVLAGVPLAAQAHPGHELASSFSGGLAHPLGGLDHLLAMVAVGLWAGRLGGRARWLLPPCFSVLMIVGGTLGGAGIRVPGAEALMLASVLVLGLAVATTTRAPFPISASLVGFFALAHGHAHGTDIGAATSGVLYGCGFVLASILLQLAGLGLAQLARRSQKKEWLRYAGIGIATAGGMLCLGW